MLLASHRGDTIADKNPSERTNAKKATRAVLLACLATLAASGAALSHSDGNRIVIIGKGLIAIGAGTTCIGAGISLWKASRPQD
jgi:hypothetical protein